MKILFIHPAYASQFYHFIRHLLGGKGDYQITFLSSADNQDGKRLSLGESGQRIPGVRHVHFGDSPRRKDGEAPWVTRFVDEAMQGRAVFEACGRMRQSGYVPDIIVGHGRWGACLFVKDAYPDVLPLLLYSEFFSTAANARECLPPGAVLTDDNAAAYRLANGTNLVSLEAADHVITPTEFQKQSHPAIFHSKTSVIFDGVDAQRLSP